MGKTVSVAIFTILLSFLACGDVLASSSLQILEISPDSGNLGKDVTIRIENPADLEISNLNLYIDGHPVKDQLIPTGTNQLTFRIGNKPGTSKRDLQEIEYLHELAWGRTYATKSYYLSLWIKDSKFQSNRVKFKFTYLSPRIFWLVFIGVGALLSIISFSSRKYNPVIGHDGKLSLAKFQMTVWTWIILSGYLYLVLLKGEIFEPDASILWLMGIASTTFLGAKSIAKSRAEKRISELEPLIEEKQNELGKGSISADKRTKLNGEITSLQAELSALTTPADRTKPWKWVDLILDDQNNTSLHKLQMLIWTLLIGVVFIWFCYRDQQFITIPTTLLGLMGISSGTYIGYQIPKKK